MGNILIIDDDLEICDTMNSLVSRQDHSCQSAQSLKEGGKLLQTEKFDVVFLDVSLPDGNGLEILPTINELPDSPEVIILTGKGDPDGAELAIKQGVWDYILKPSSVREITLTLSRALRYRQEKVGEIDDTDFSTETIIGSSPEIKAACNQAMLAARSNSNLLITGETGTGKEVFAQTIHQNSNRSQGAFIVVDCAALTESLVESILFGHRKGAFTGAHDNQTGLIKLAHNGTLFLDEIGEMPLTIQKTFLRVLQEKTFRPVGEPSEKQSNFRLIAATNRNLDQMAEKGEFRSDLLYRIKTMMIHLPPLKNRNGDIKILTSFRVNHLCEQFGVEPKQVDNDFHELLERYSWPGNVRELFNTVERAVISAGDEKQLFSMHLPRSLRIKLARDQIESLSKIQEESLTENPTVRNIGQDIVGELLASNPPSLKDFKTDAEKIYLEELIAQYQGNLKELLQVSGLSRSHFYSLIKKHNLTIQTE